MLKVLSSVWRAVSPLPLVPKKEQDTLHFHFARGHVGEGVLEVKGLRGGFGIE